MTERLPNYYYEAVELKANYQQKLAEGQRITPLDEVQFTLAIWVISGFQKKERDERSERLHPSRSTD